MNRFIFYFFIFFILNFTNAQQNLNSSWTWISGYNSVNQTGIYGNQGISNIFNIPGGRYYSISWIDSNNNLLLFGGEGYDSNGNQGNK